MSYLVLARKWRPTTFDDVIGQGHVTQTLKNAISRDRVAHALLFTGSRGIGKTSCARILAKALNCQQGPTPEPCGQCPACVEITSGHSVDVFEIDGASNNSVEQVREIRESVKFLPTQGKKKMYIIDEVHMLSTGAFNALLKTLEEPPEHVIFVLATTEPHKIPETILSRCQRFDFKRIPERAIAEALKRIAEAEGVRVDLPALSHIAREAEGGMRDSLSLLDQVISFCGTEISEKQVREVLGIADRGLLHTLIGALIAADGRAALQIIDDLFQFGIDLQKFSGELLKYVRDLMVVRICDDAARLVDQTEDEITHMRDLVEPIEPARIHRLFNALLKGADEIARSAYPKLVLEMTALRICHQGPTLPLADVLKGLSRLEAKLGDLPEGDPDGGSGSPPGGPPPGGSAPSGGGSSRQGGGMGAANQSHASGGADASPQQSASQPAPQQPAPQQPAAQSSSAEASEPASELTGEESDIFARVAALVEQGVPAPEPEPEDPAPYKRGPSDASPMPSGGSGGPEKKAEAQTASTAPVPQAQEAKPAAPAAHAQASAAPEPDDMPPPEEDLPAEAFEPPPEFYAESGPHIEIGAEITEPSLTEIGEDEWPDPAESTPWILPEIPVPGPDDPAPWPPASGPLAVIAAKRAGWIAPTGHDVAPAASGDQPHPPGSALAALAAEVGLQAPTAAAEEIPSTRIIERPDPASLPVIPDRPDHADGPINWAAEQHDLARLQQLLVRLRRGSMRQKVEFLGIHLEANGHLITLNREILTLAVPASEYPTLEPHEATLTEALEEAAGHPMTLTLIPCPPGDPRLSAETLRTRSLRILSERAEAMKAHAKAHDRVIDALEIFGGEITEIIPHGV